jgi:hypothetical protein
MRLPTQICPMLRFLATDAVPIRDPYFPYTFIYTNRVSGWVAGNGNRTRISLGVLKPFHR